MVLRRVAWRRNARPWPPKSAFTFKLDFPVGVTELVLFEPKDAPDDQE